MVFNLSESKDSYADEKRGVGKRGTPRAPVRFAFWKKTFSFFPYLFFKKTSGGTTNLVQNQTAA
jgi:hypothetical protein